MSERVRVAVTGPLTWDAHELGVIHIDAADLRAAGWVPASDAQTLRDAFRRYLDADAAVTKGGYGGPIHHYERERDEALAALTGEAGSSRSQPKEGN